MKLLWYFIFSNYPVNDYQLIQHSNYISAIEIIVKYEGFRRRPYVDSDGKLAIGFGHRRNVMEYQIMSYREAKIRMKNDLKYRLKRLRRMITVPLNQNQTNALLSLAYNVGLGNFARSDLLRKLNKCNFRLESEFKRWVYVKKKHNRWLIKRRNAEWGLFKKSVSTQVVHYTFCN